jgi:hypothetical protein
MPPGAKPGQRFGGRQKGTPNKQSLPMIRGSILQKDPDLDSGVLLRRAAAVICDELNKALAGKYKPKEVVDWAVKLGRIAADCCEGQLLLSVTSLTRRWLGTTNPRRWSIGL